MDEQGENVADGRGVNANANIEQLLLHIRAQNDRLEEMERERQQDRQRAELERTTTAAALQTKINASAIVTLGGGIYGYKNGTILTPGERDFYALVTSFGVNNLTADEVFRQGLTSMESLRGITGSKLKNVIYNINRNKSPDCPQPNKVFLGATFEENVAVLVSWLKFQRVIGGRPTAAAWISDPNARDKTNERIQYLTEVKESEGTEDIKLPDALTDMKRFKDFSEHLLTYLRIKRGAASVPLIYVVRDEETVTDVDRIGTVGRASTDAYKNWDDYSIRCVEMVGTHWDSDNTSFWQIISKLVRDGPGWDYIRTFEKKGDGDGRGAYMALYKQAYQYSNVRALKSEANANLRKLRFDGPTRSWNFDKYVRGWLKNLAVLKRYNAQPPEDDIVAAFCAGIGDPRLIQSVSNVLVDDSVYTSDFDKTQKYLTNVLSVAKGQQTLKRSNISSTSTRTTAKYTGPLEAKDYTNEQWGSMDRKQKETIRKKRKAAYQDKKRKVSATATETPASDGAQKEVKDAGNQFGSRAHAQKKRAVVVDQ